MAKEKKLGICSICGKLGELTKEHVPPQKAFNKGRWTQLLYEDKEWRLDPLVIPQKKVFKQGGITFLSICAKCNNDTGSWYADAFSDWCHYGMDILKRSKGKSSFYIPNSLKPLNAIKQIITMFLAINDPSFGKRNQELVKFVLNRDIQPLPSSFKVWAYYKSDSKLRYVKESYIGNLTRSGKPIMITEIAFPPYGFVLSDACDNSEIDKRLVNITHFSYHNYNETCSFDIKLPTLPTEINIPGDYRSKDEISKTIAENRLKYPD